MKTIKQAREDAGLTMEQVRIALGINSVQNYAKKENYTDHFKGGQLLRFCDLVNIDVHDLKVLGYN